MFEACLEKASLFKKIIESIKDLLGDVNIECTESGISFKSMDSSSIALVSLSLEFEGFEYFNCKENISIGLNIESLNKILNRARDDDRLTLKIEKDSMDLLCLEFKNATSNRKNVYKLRLMDIDQSHLSIPELDYNILLKLPSQEFRRICQDLMVIDDSVVINAEKNESYVRFNAGNNIGECNIEIKSQSNEEDPITVNVGSDIDICFSLKYLLMFSKGSTLSQHVKISLLDGMPILLEYKFDNGYVRYYLAPKVTE
jgi:proliferating cell nuclear antigen